MLKMKVYKRGFLTCIFVTVFHIPITRRVSRDVEHGGLCDGLHSLAHVSPCSTSRLPGVLVVMWHMDAYKRGFAHMHFCSNLPHRDNPACYSRCTKWRFLEEGLPSHTYLFSFSTSRLLGVLVAMWKMEVYVTGFAHLHICHYFPHREYLAC